MRDREGVFAALETARKLASGRVIAAGHSYGGRQSAMLAAERPGAADGLLLLSYPLHPPGKPRAEAHRLLPFPADARACSSTERRTRSARSRSCVEAMALIPARTDVLPVEGAAHDLKRAAGLAAEMLTRLRAILSTA